tara:strand:- start:343 stop:1200 length:858 start_codon:yes stop_codon:yes gene_type:complete
MAWKFKQEMVQNGQVIEPSEFRNNVNELIGEFNGMLDSDNIGFSAVDTPMIQRGAFTEVYSSNVDPRAAYHFNYTEGAGWVNSAIMRRDGNAVSGAEEDFYEYCVSLQQYGLADDTKLASSDISDYVKINLPSCSFHGTSDGLVKAEFSGFIQWLPINYGHDYDNDDYLVAHGTWRDDYPYKADLQKRLRLAHADILCSQWRIVINGQAVAESGFLGSEHSSHPIYLVGAIPVVKSSEINVQIQGRFVWFSPLTHEIKPASSHGAPIRRDCTLCCPVLVSTYRKR